MNLLKKIFKKKEDDFSFDTDTSFSPPGTNDPFSTPTSDPFAATTADPFGSETQQDSLNTTKDPFGPIDSFETNNDPFASTPQPTKAPQSSTPLPPIENTNHIPQTRGSQIAQEYINKQRTSQKSPAQTTNSTNNSQSHSLEIINLKLDGIKSQLEILNQRLQKVEREPKKQW